MSLNKKMNLIYKTYIEYRDCNISSTDIDNTGIRVKIDFLLPSVLQKNNICYTKTIFVKSIFLYDLRDV